MEVRPIVSSLLRNKTGALLITAQVALTLAIVTNASHVITERLALSQRPAGVDRESSILTTRPVLTGAVNLDALQQRDLASLRALPNVESVSLMNQVPLGRGGWNSTIAKEPRREAASVSVGMYFDSGTAIKTLGLRLLQGRGFTPDEVLVVDPETSSAEPPIVIVTQALAKAFFPDEVSYVGRTLYLGSSADSQALRIVGVVERLQTPWAQASASNEYSILQPKRYLRSHNYYVVRARPGAEDEVRQSMAAALAANEPERVSPGEYSITELRDRRYRGERGVAWLLLAVTGFLLLVTASGIVGMVSLWVNQRRKQIGVRRALGATRADIVRYFMTENLLIAVLGVGVGALGARLLNALLMRELSLPALPSRYVAAGVLVLLLLSLGSVLGPALRASRLSPALATRSI